MLVTEGSLMKIHQPALKTATHLFHSVTGTSVKKTHLFIIGHHCQCSDLHYYIAALDQGGHIFDLCHSPKLICFFQIYLYFTFRYILYFRYWKQGYPLILIAQDKQPSKTSSLAKSTPEKYYGQLGDSNSIKDHPSLAFATNPKGSLKLPWKLRSRHSIDGWVLGCKCSEYM